MQGINQEDQSDFGNLVINYLHVNSKVIIDNNLKINIHIGSSYFHSEDLTCTGIFDRAEYSRQVSRALGSDRYQNYERGE